MKYFFFGLFVWLFLFPKEIPAQGLVLKEPPTNVARLPLEWRGMWLSLDATNRFKDNLSKMNYGLTGSAVVGYKNYNFRMEAIAPISDDAWLYRVRFEYQIF